jgi:hypothetical protein
VRYEHQYRNGEKDSTSWGSSYMTGVHTTGTSGLNYRKFVPSFRDINESRDILTADARHTVFGNTEVNLGFRYEYARNLDALNMRNRPYEPNQKTTVVDLYTTQVDKLTSDLLNAHVATETRFLNDRLWWTMGYSYTSINSNTEGSRVTGLNNYYPAYNVTYASGWLGSFGGSESNQHVINLNLFAIPWNDLTLLAAARFELSENSSDNYWYYTSNSSRSGLTLGYRHALTTNDWNTFNQSLELRYTGLANTVLYARAEWEERQGSLQEWLFYLYSATPTANQIDDGFKDSDVLSQKYSVGANWYPFRQVNLSVQYYHRIQENDYGFSEEPGIISHMASNTDNVNARITLKPMTGLTLVSRYDFQRTIIDTQGELSWVQSSANTAHMFTESVTWSPLARFYAQGNFSYVINETNSPAGSVVATGSSSGLTSYNGTPVTHFTNNYWTAGGGFGLAIDDKTDLRAEYSYYHANNYNNNATNGMPYGAGAEEHTVSATVGRQLAKNIHLSVKYSYYKYTDKTSGFNNNYDAHVIYSGVQICF